ncbi:MAG: transcriptional regulator [Nanohaloarchaea archaeon]|nr:transcriptional regulator [Candidatus Nanohaloarchaea archaeon]
MRIDSKSDEVKGFKESETLEFKTSTSELKEGVISIAAMLNKHHNDELIFGVKPNGEIIGQTVTEKTLRDVSKTISDHVEPKIYPEIKKEAIENKSCISILFSGDNSPYFAYGRAYMRVADEDKQVSSSELRKLFLKRSDESWESKFSDKTIESINEVALINFIQKANESKRINFKFRGTEDTLYKLYLIKDNKLLRAAEILFCDDNSSEVQVAVFAGIDKITFLDIRQFKGNLFSIKEQAEAYIKNHMNWRANLTGSGREEIPEVPLRAIEEAIVNSLCHRDYSVLKGNEIAFYKDRIEIFNVGQFPEEKTPEDYIKGEGESILRNPLIANTLFLSSDIEKWGSGIKRIYESCKQAGVNVRFEKTITGFKIVFYRFEKDISSNDGVSKVVDGQLNGQLSGQLRDVYGLIIQKPGIIAKEISKELGRPYRTVIKQIYKLENSNMVERRGSKKTGGYYVRTKFKPDETEK